MLSKEVSSTIFNVFGMIWPGIEHRSPGPLVNTLLTRPMYHYLKNDYFEFLENIYVRELESFYLYILYKVSRILKSRERIFYIDKFIILKLGDSNQKNIKVKTNEYSPCYFIVMTWVNVYMVIIRA